MPPITVAEAEEHFVTAPTRARATQYLAVAIFAHDQDIISEATLNSAIETVCIWLIKKGCCP